MDEWKIFSYYTHQQHKVKVNRFYTWTAPCSWQFCKQPSQSLSVPNLCQMKLGSWCHFNTGIWKKKIKMRGDVKREAENWIYQNQPAGLTWHWPAPRVVTYPSAREFHTAWRRGRLQKCLSPLISYRLESCPHRKLAPAEFKSAFILCVKLNQYKPMCGRVIVMYLQDGRETGMKAFSSLPIPFLSKSQP